MSKLFTENKIINGIQKNYFTIIKLKKNTALSFRRERKNNNNN